MLLDVFTLHEHFAFLTLDQRVVTGLDRVEIQVLPSGLGGQVGALAQFVGNLLLVDASGVVEVSMEGQGLLSDFKRLLYEDDRGMMLGRHVLFQGSLVFKAHCWLAVCAPENEAFIEFRQDLLLRVLGDDGVQELKLVITAADCVFLLPGLSGLLSGLFLFSLCLLLLCRGAVRIEIKVFIDLRIFFV